MRQISWDGFSALDIRGVLPEFTMGKKTALTIGVFDGLHRGHKALLDKIVSKAPDLSPVALTFRENPKKITCKQNKAADIITLKEKMALLDSFGVSLCVLIDFSENFSRMKGKAFLEAIDRYLFPAYIALGADFHCGYRKETDAITFKAWAEDLGIQTEIIPWVMEGGMPVSSSRIRQAIKAGNTKQAELLLGRPLVNGSIDNSFNKGF